TSVFSVSLWFNYFTVRSHHRDTENTEVAQSGSLLFCQTAIKPGLCSAPFSLDCDGRDVQDFGCLLNCQTTKESELHDAALSRIDCRQFLQRLVQSDHLRRFLL